MNPLGVPAFGARVALYLAAMALLMLALARWTGGGAARADRERQVADSATAAGARTVARIRQGAIAAGKYYLTTEAPHVRSIEASDRTVARARAAADAAEAQRLAALEAAADSARTLPELRLELTRSAVTIGALQLQVVALSDTLLEERAAADRRIRAARAHADSLERVIVAQDSLEVARVRQLAAADRQRPRWWQRLFALSCESGGAAGGASIGALTAGPPGAAVGAVVGVLGGAIACR